MANFTKSRRQGKPKKPTKPYPEFPLYAHATGRWAKKIRGKLLYFGPWDDPDAALQKYLDQKDELHAGRTPRYTGDGLRVGELCNRFLTGKKHLLDSGELKPSTFQEYYAVCEKIVRVFQRNRLVDDLATDDFESFRSSLSKGRGPVALGKDVRVTRMAFKYAFDSGLIDKPVRYGPNFKMPSRKILRQARQTNGRRMFESEELREIIGKATQPLKAMILLGINAGMGNTDVALVPQSVIDFESGWMEYPRPKTAVERRIPLWPETIEILKDAVGGRPQPKDESDAGLIFLTKYGQRWVRNSNTKKQRWTDAVCLQFGKLLSRLDLKQPGLNFYALRQTFETIGGESKDQVAVNAIMGHVDNSMAGVYRERISDERLKAVTDTVREWLWGA